MNADLLKTFSANQSGQVCSEETSHSCPTICIAVQGPCKRWYPGSDKSLGTTGLSHRQQEKMDWHRHLLIIPDLLDLVADNAS